MEIIGRFIGYVLLLVVLILVVPTMFGLTSADIAIAQDEVEAVIGQFWTEDFASDALSHKECGLLLEYSDTEFVATMNYFLFGVYEWDAATPFDFYADEYVTYCFGERDILVRTFTEYQEIHKETIIEMQNSPHTYVGKDGMILPKYIDYSKWTKREALIYVQ